jgi:uncharacterized iron-regulated membrane protein
MRKLLLTLHRYAALATGVFVVFLGVSGSIMAFEEQLDHVFHPHLFVVTPQAQARSLAELGAAASKTHPGAQASGYGMSVSPDLSYSVSFRGTAIFVNQHTGEVLGTRSGPTWLSNVHQFHLRLLAGEVGKKIVSWVGVVILFLLVSGFYLWWPQKRAAIEWGGASLRVWFDLHNAVGIFSLAFLLLLTITGVIIGFESVSTPVLYTLSGSTPPQSDFQATPQPGVTPQTPDQAVAIARAALPGAAPIAVNVPGPKGVYRVALRYPEDLTPGGRSRVYIDPYGGRVLMADSSRTTVAGARLVIANRAIHTGDLFGIPSKAVMALASLMVALQVVSGVVMWWKRR